MLLCGGQRNDFEVRNGVALGNCASFVEMTQESRPSRVIRVPDRAYVSAYHEPVLGPSDDHVKNELELPE